MDQIRVTNNLPFRTNRIKCQLVTPYLNDKVYDVNNITFIFYLNSRHIEKNLYLRGFLSDKGKFSHFVNSIERE